MDLFQRLLLVGEGEKSVKRTKVRLRRADQAIRRSNELMAQSNRLMQKPHEHTVQDKDCPIHT